MAIERMPAIERTCACGHGRLDHLNVGDDACRYRWHPDLTIRCKCDAFRDASDLAVIVEQEERRLESRAAAERVKQEIEDRTREAAKLREERERREAVNNDDQFWSGLREELE